MRVVLSLLLFTAAASAQPLFPVEQTNAGTPSAVVYLAEGGGALLGAVAGAIPAAVILPYLTLALIIANLGNDGGETEGGELLVAAGVAGAVCVVGGTAAGVCAVGRRYAYTQTTRMTAGSLLGSVAGWTTGVTLLLVGGGMIANPGSKLEEAGGYAVGALGVLAVPSGAVVGYNLATRRENRRFGGLGDRWEPPSLLPCAVAAVDGSVKPGIRAQLVTVRF